MSNQQIFARHYSKGMGQAVADRTINRAFVEPLDKTEQMIITLSANTERSVHEEVNFFCKQKGLVIDKFELLKKDSNEIKISLSVKAKIKVETWADVAKRVAVGNSLLHKENQPQEKDLLHAHLAKATILLSGRHLQHGDSDQPSRNMEVFTNCATSAMSFLKFYLLLNGSGVGRSMDDDLMVVDYRYLPIITSVIDQKHLDVTSGKIIGKPTLKEALHLYRDREIHHFKVPDSREGWAKAIEKIEILCFQKSHRHCVLLIDFSDVRPKGAPIKGMQNRPAAGPQSLMNAIDKIAQLREAQMEPWRATMFVDHYLAECVLVGGARRAARMATKTWRDQTVFDFISIKRDGFLWSSNNSVTVDHEFWTYIKNPQIKNAKASHARKVFEAITSSAYFDNTGEPGIINQDKLTQNDRGFDGYLDGFFAESKKYQLDTETLSLTKLLAAKAHQHPLHQITNPCGEITLNLLGGYCVIGDVVPYHADSDEESVEAFKVATRALLRVNLMDSMYQKEVHRTNRIGVGITGLHEWAWKRFGYGWKDLIDEEKSKPLWLMLSIFKRAVVNEANRYSKVLGQNTPHTNTTIKPAGTTSKLFGLTEGAHLPSMREFIRWVQFRNDDPLIEYYRERGYRVRELASYQNTSIVGFPTQPEICKLGMKDHLVTASEATPKEQYQYLRLLEKYWITGVEADGHTPLTETGNQVSYTLKYDPSKVSYEEFVTTLIEGQSSVRCCSVMPQINLSAYEYQPEEKISSSEYIEMIDQILAKEVDSEEISIEHIDCITNACPVEFRQK